MLPDPSNACGARRCARGCGRASPAQPPPAADVDGASDEDAVYRTPFYRRFRAVDRVVRRRIADSCWSRRSRVFVGALGAVPLRAAAVLPASSRPELLVDLRLPEGQLVRGDARRSEENGGDPRRARAASSSYVAYVGVGSPRFYLPLDQQLHAVELRAVRAGREEQRRARARARSRLLAAVRRRLSGPARPRLAARERAAGRLSRAVPRVGRGHRHACASIAQQAADIVRARSGHARRAVRLGRADEGRSASSIDQNKARLLGVSSQDLAAFLNNSLSGITVTLLPRARQADRSAAARRGRQSARR